MSSHREAPEIAKDPVADNTDVYAFVSPDQSDTVTLITNYIPLQEAASGPNFYEFGDDVLYEIHIDNNGDGIADITYQFCFTTEVRNPNTFLYNTGPIASLNSPNWNRRQMYAVTKIENGHAALLANNLMVPPCNIGPRSTPDYGRLAGEAIHTLPGGEKVFAGQRSEGFYVDLGSLFDLLDLRPFQSQHLIPSPDIPGADATNGTNVHTIAIQVPKQALTRDHSYPRDPHSVHAVIGAWGSASRQKVTMYTEQGRKQTTGPWVQVSRLGNPLVNELMIPMGKKDLWNAQGPQGDRIFAEHIQYPELARLLATFYPGAFPHLAELRVVREDLVAMLLTGMPTGLIAGFQNFTGKGLADMLRLNMAIPPTSMPDLHGLLGNDLAGFPNGRRVFDDVVTIMLRAIAGVTYALINRHFEPDEAAAQLTDGVVPSNRAIEYLASFPYLGVPSSGFDQPASSASTCTNGV
jgi:Domain of unknown function (DUF4331)